LFSIWIQLALLYSIVAFVAYFFLGSFIFGAGFQPTPKREIDLAARLVGLQAGTVVYDLGSGTGSVVFYLAEKYSAKCVGIEVDPLRYGISVLKLRFSGALKDRVSFQRGNLLDCDLSKADVVYAFLSGGTGVMKALESKIQKEMKPGSKIISYVHLFKDWAPEAASGDVRVYRMEKAP
jgi:precorrin-6B methylase 2